MYPGTTDTKYISPRKTKALQFKEPEDGKTIFSTAAIIPAANIFETSGEYLMVIAAPGLERENFSIGVDQSMITISAKKEHVPRSWVSDRFEFDYTDWTRAFTLPSDADAMFADATYQNGELLIHIPRGSTCESPENVTIYVY